MDGPLICEYCGKAVPASAQHIDMDGWMRLDGWTSETVLGVHRPMSFCRPEHLVEEMSRRRLR